MPDNYFDIQEGMKLTAIGRLALKNNLSKDTIFTVRIIKGNEIGVVCETHNIEGWHNLNGTCGDERGYWFYTGEDGDSFFKSFRIAEKTPYIIIDGEFKGTSLVNEKCIILKHLSGNRVLVELDKDIGGSGGDGLGKSGHCIVIHYSTIKATDKPKKKILDKGRKLFDARKNKEIKVDIAEIKDELPEGYHDSYRGGIYIPEVEHETYEAAEAAQPSFRAIGKAPKTIGRTLYEDREGFFGGEHTVAGIKPVKATTVKKQGSINEAAILSKREFNNRKINEDIELLTKQYINEGPKHKKGKSRFNDMFKDIAIRTTLKETGEVPLPERDDSREKGALDFVKSFDVPSDLERMSKVTDFEKAATDEEENVINKAIRDLKDQAMSRNFGS